MDGIVGIKCRVVNSTKEFTLELLLSTDTDAMAIQKYKESLEGSFHHARIEREPWFPVQVHRVNKLRLKDLHDQDSHDELCKRYGPENCRVEIKRMRRLGNKAHLSYRSIVGFNRHDSFMERE